MGNIYIKLMNIQQELIASKSQFNKFGQYAYRSCEDILSSLKPLMKKEKVVIILSDSLELIGTRYYVKSTASLIDIETNETISNTAYSREEESKKGMDGSQITGASSSYARKYALNGLFGIDDSKDSDTTNTGEKNKPKPKTEPEKKAICIWCKKEIPDVTLKDGKIISGFKFSTDYGGKCPECVKKAFEESKRKEQEIKEREKREQEENKALEETKRELELKANQENKQRMQVKAYQDDKLKEKYNKTSQENNILKQQIELNIPEVSNIIKKQSSDIKKSN